jgi:alpha-beta hydrolase superfamily lysophospholipase
VILLAPFLLTLGLMQLAVAHFGLCGASLTGRRRRPGYLMGALLLVAGAHLLPACAVALVMVIPASLLAIACLAAGGSLACSDSDPAYFLRPGDWPVGRCRAVQIPNAGQLIPGLLVTPPLAESAAESTGAAVCLVHGYGDNKTAFKWRLIGALLRQGLTVLTIDLAGHGQNPAVQRWPDCTGELPAALEWLRQQRPGRPLGLLGISVGGAFSAHAALAARPDALVICETPIRLTYSRSLVWREAWDMLRSPLLDVLRETTLWQIRRMWNTQPVRREIGLLDLLQRLDVPGCAARLTCPLLLVYGRRDRIAPLAYAERLRQAAGAGCRLVVVPGASHLAVTLVPAASRAIAGWLAAQLSGLGSPNNS